MPKSQQITFNLMLLEAESCTSLVNLWAELPCALHCLSRLEKINRLTRRGIDNMPCLLKTWRIKFCLLVICDIDVFSQNTDDCLCFCCSDGPRVLYLRVEDRTISSLTLSWVVDHHVQNQHSPRFELMYRKKVTKHLFSLTFFHRTKKANRIGW